ncbi:GNAT family N-acetyltransferase [Nostoc sp. LPT]|uniref:GNAT family N-acetyltransferase n=1 Tax=Nostoc sp. LPT TaxID=2815387 RepID=UPI001E16FD8C|nr:GNAT family N-acetyltransferase [Nostoc sp. LPT]MBN4000881.1 GNAT family N-acetyltransferase [Nostoc sp. LPT]
MHTNIDNIFFSVNPAVSNDDLNALFASAWGWPQDLHNDFQPMLERSIAYTCAYCSERLIGFVNLAWDGGFHTFISEAVVHQDFQRRGIGSQLVRQAIDVARHKKVKWVHVDYEPHLQNFYQNCGFYPTSAGLIKFE